LLLLSGALHVRPQVSYMYEDINSFLARLNLTTEFLRRHIILIIIDVHFKSRYCGTILIVVDIYRMADADNRVILNVGGIRHETCTYEINKRSSNLENNNNNNNNNNSKKPQERLTKRVLHYIA
jgi:hypothetical protein